MFLEILGSTFPDINHRLLRVYARLQQLSNVNYPRPINLFVQVANVSREQEKRERKSNRIFRVNNKGGAKERA